MGNRAVIAFDDQPTSPAIYLHWNGGRASVEGFLAAARQCDIRYTTEETTMNEIAALVARHFFDINVNEAHIYRMPFSRVDTDNLDNGTYIIDRQTFEITGRLFIPERDEEIDAKKTAGIIEKVVRLFRDAQKIIQQAPYS